MSSKVQTCTRIMNWRNYLQNLPLVMYTKGSCLTSAAISKTHDKTLTDKIFCQLSKAQNTYRNRQHRESAGTVQIGHTSVTVQLGLLSSSSFTCPLSPPSFLFFLFFYWTSVYHPSVIIFFSVRHLSLSESLHHLM